jgi:protein-L-isoaspartate(D-aspartate) O-methyltransferase
MPWNRHSLIWVLLVCTSLIGCLASPTAVAEEKDYGAMRRKLRAEIEQVAAETSNSTGRPRFSGRVMDAIDSVPRHRFVPARELKYAYENRPLPIGYGQTISQPYMVAIICQTAEVKEGDRALDIGTGSGYQAAVLAELGAHVCTVERIPELAELARERLAAAGYEAVDVHVGDGSVGLPEHAPFDAIVVAAAAPVMPNSLYEQLVSRGRLVVPVGGPHGQRLEVIVRSPEGPAVTRSVPCRFVPLVGAEGF